MSMFLKFHSCIFALLFTYRFFMLKQQHKDWTNLIKSQQLAFISIIIIICATKVSRMTYKQYEVFFMFILTVANYNTVYEKVARYFGSFMIPTHAQEIITVVSIYFGLHAPIPWTRMIGIMGSAQAYQILFQILT